MEEPVMGCQLSTRDLSTNGGDTPLPPISTAEPDMSNEKNYPKYLWCIHTWS